jgi:hypothetical protein
MQVKKVKELIIISIAFAAKDKPDDKKYGHVDKCDKKPSHKNCDEVGNVDIGSNTNQQDQTHDEQHNDKSKENNKPQHEQGTGLHNQHSH